MPQKKHKPEEIVAKLRQVASFNASTQNSAFPKSGEHLVFTPSGITLFSDNKSDTLTFADWLADRFDTGADD